MSFLARPLAVLAVSAAALCIACGAAMAADDTFRCGGKLVSTELAPSEVIALCGEPTSKSTEQVPQYARNANGTMRRIGTATVETWIYDRGPTQFPARLRFEDGKLVSVELVRP